MTFSSTLQLRIFGDHSLDKKLASPRGLVERDGDNHDNHDNHSERRFSFSSDGKWPSSKRDEEHNGASRGFVHAPPSAHQQNGDADGSTSRSHHESGGAMPVPVSNGAGVENGGSLSSDWNAISSNSFDETYLEGNYSSGGMTLDPASSNNFNEHMSKLGLENGDPDLPVFAMPYPGTNWFLGGKNAPGAPHGSHLPAMGGLTPHSQAPSSSMGASRAAFTTSSSTATFRAGDMQYPGKPSGEAIPYPSDVPSPVQMESFAPCVPYALEPSELLFEDVSSWTGATSDAYDNQHYQQQHGQPFYNVSSHTPNGYLHFDGSGTSNMPTGLHEYTPSYQQNQTHASGSAASSIYRLMQNREEPFPTDPRWTPAENCQQYPTPSTTNTTPTSSATNFVTHNGNCDRGNQRPNALRSLLTSNEDQPEQNTKRVLRSSTPTQRTPHNCLHHSESLPKSVNPMLGKLAQFPVASSASTSQSAKIQLLTALNDCYWKNGRKNLQCFPSCPEHHDFYSMKMNNRKHSSVGVCRGPVYCHAFTDASEFLPAASTQQMKHDATGLSGGNGAREMFVLGRFERVPQQDSTNLLEELNAPPTFPSAALFEQFRYTCFQAVEMEERRVLLPEASAETHDPSTQAPDSSALKSGPATHKKRIIRSTWFFLPDVWKVQPMLKKKRKATRSAPAQTFPFCFRIFIYTRDADGPGFSCVSDTASSFFELYSTRTVDRVKRKYWSGESASRHTAGQRATKHRGLKRL